MLINSSICLIFPTCVLHSSMICADKNKQSENVFFLPVFPATLFLLFAAPQSQHGSPSLWNSVNRKSFRQWPYVTFCGWNDASLSSRGCEVRSERSLLRQKPRPWRPSAPPPSPPLSSSGCSGTTNNNLTDKHRQLGTFFPP